MVLHWLRRIALNIALVVVVACEQSLNAVPSQLRLTFFDSFSVLPLLVIDMIGVEVVNVDIWDVLGVHLLLREGVPVEVLEPWVALQLVRPAAVPNSVCWFPLQALVDEVCCPLVPPVRDP